MKQPSEAMLISFLRGIADRETVSHGNQLSLDIAQHMPNHFF